MHDFYEYSIYDELRQKRQVDLKLLIINRNCMQILKYLSLVQFWLMIANNRQFEGGTLSSGKLGSTFFPDILCLEDELILV